MESLQIPREVAAFLTEPHLGVLATVSSVGNPQTTVVWYEFRDSAFWFYVGKRSHKARNVRRSPRVSLTIDERQYPYKGVVVYGNAKEVDFDEERACRIAIRYMGQEDGEAMHRAMMTGAKRTGIRLIPERMHRWDFTDWDYKAQSATVAEDSAELS